MSEAGHEAGEIRIPVGYPYRLSDEEIEATLATFMAAIEARRYDINAVLRYGHVIQIGQNELERRLVEQMRKTTHEASEASSKTARRALWVAGAGVAVGLAGVVVAALT